MKKNTSRPFQVVLDIDSGSCVMRSVRADCVVVIDTFENLGASW